VTVLPSVGPPQMAAKNLSARLDALAELTRTGRQREGADGFTPELLDDSEALLRRAGERLRLSANHTVVALAGGTGSGNPRCSTPWPGPASRPPG